MLFFILLLPFSFLIFCHISCELLRAFLTGLDMLLCGFNESLYIVSSQVVIKLAQH